MDTIIGKKFWNSKIEEIIHTPRVWKNQTRPDPNNRGTDWHLTGNGVNWLYGLYEMIEENFEKDSILVEIGSFSGVSTSMFACVCEFVYAVDPWSDYSEINSGFLNQAESEFDNRMKQYSNVEKIKLKSEDAVKLFPNESVDVVYIDGEHKYESVLFDIQAWLPKIVKGGLLCGHDYIEDGIQKALKNTFPNHTFNMYWDSSWVYKKQ